MKKTLPIAAMMIILAGGCDVKNNNHNENAKQEPSTMTDSKITQLVKNDTKVGEGSEAVNDRLVVVHYTGWLYDPKADNNRGAKFDSSVDRNQPFDFMLGAGQVIKGWDQGVAGMKVGGQRTLIIPPEMGYGSRGAGGVIPPNATLMFDVELLDVK